MAFTSPPIITSKRIAVENRPTNFLLNPHDSLADSLAFAGLGEGPGNNTFVNSQQERTRYDGQLTNMDPDTDWQWHDELHRWGLETDGISKDVVHPSLNLGEVYTVAFWINPTATGDALWTNGAYHYYCWYFSNPSTSAHRCDFDGAQSVTFSGHKTIVVGEWVHYCVRRRFRNCQLFLDGEYQMERVLGNSGPMYIFHLGRSNWYYDGLFADPMAWRRELDDSEIKTIADRDDPMMGRLLLPPRRRFWMPTEGVPAPGVTADGASRAAPAWANGLATVLSKADATGAARAAPAIADGAADAVTKVTATGAARAAPAIADGTADAIAGVSATGAARAAPAIADGTAEAVTKLTADGAARAAPAIGRGVANILGAVVSAGAPRAAPAIAEGNASVIGQVAANGASRAAPAIAQGLASVAGEAICLGASRAAPAVGSGLATIGVLAVGAYAEAAQTYVPGAESGQTWVPGAEAAQAR